MRSSENTDATGLHRKLIAAMATQLINEGYGTEEAAEFTPVGPGTILCRTETGITKAVAPSHSSSELLSVLTTMADAEVNAVDVFLSTRSMAADFIDAGARTDVFRQTLVRCYVGEQGSYTRYVPSHADGESDVTLYQAALQVFVDDFLPDSSTEIDIASREDLYDQFSCWFHNVTALEGPSRSTFGQLLAAAGIDTVARKTDDTVDVVIDTTDDPRR